MPTKNKLSFDKMRSIFFFSLIIALSIAMLYLFRPFFFPVFWAAVITVMFYPFYKWLGNHIKSNVTNITITMVSVVVILLLPLTFISTIVVNESVDLYQSVSSEDLQTALNTAHGWLGNTFVGPFIEQAQQEWPAYVSKAAQVASNTIFTSIKSITQNSVRFMFLLFIMFYSLYYFLKDGQRMLDRLVHFSPLGDKYEKMLFERFTSTTRATMKSTLIIGGIQGVLSGILFWITGIEGAFIWGVIMVIFAIIPAIGPGIILIPAGIIMLILGSMWQAVVLLVGAFIIGFIDNLLRPPLVGKDIQMHPLVVLFATLGGIFLFGISGFVIGPIIAALYISIMSIYDHYYRSELQNN